MNFNRTSRTSRPRNKSRHNRLGAITVEFAICCSVFFMMIFAGLEFSRYFYLQHGIQMVAYESARAGVIPGATTATVETRVNELLTATGIPNADVDIQPTVITPQTRNVTVTITADYAENSWVPPNFLPNRTLTSSITLQHENNAYLDPEGTDIGTLIGDNDDEPVDL